MNATLPIQLIPLRLRSGIYTLLGTISLAWICLWFASDNRVPGSADGIRYVFKASCLLIGTIGAVQMMALARTRQVLGKQLMPDALWAAWVRASVVETSLIWAFLVATMSILLASRTSNTPWPAAIALLSCSVSLGAAVALAYRSMLPKRVRLIVYAIAASVLVTTLLAGTEQLLTWSVSLSPLVLSMMALCWPVLAGVLMRELRHQLRAYRWSPPLARSRMLATIDSQLRRLSPMDAYKTSFASQTTPELAAWRVRFWWLFTVTFPIYVFFNSFSPLVLRQAPDARHLMSLAFLCLAMSEFLVARDLHWRAMLMPGGWRRGRIASSIFISTLAIQTAMVAAAVVPLIWATRLESPYAPLSLVLETVASRIAPLLCELALATSVGLVMRALPKRVMTMVTVVAAVCIGCGWVYARFVVGYAMLPRAPAVGLAYIIGMAALTIVSLRVANRMWTPDKLIACARRR